MNKRGFLATLAAMCVAPFAVKASPVNTRSQKAVALTNAWTSHRCLPRFEEDLEVRLGRNWRSVLTVERYYERLDSFMLLNGGWRPVADLEPIPEDDRDHVGEAPHEHEAYVEIRIGKWRQAVRLPGSADPIECVQSTLNPETLLSFCIKDELTYPNSVLHVIRAESKAAVYKDLAERSCRILPR